MRVIRKKKMSDKIREAILEGVRGLGPEVERVELTIDEWNELQKEDAWRGRSMHRTHKFMGVDVVVEGNEAEF